MTFSNNISIKTLIEMIDHRLRTQYKEYFIVEQKIINEEKKISEIIIHTHEPTKENIEITIDEIKNYMEHNHNLTIIKNKNIKQDEILKDTYEIKILTMNRYIGG